MSSLRMHVLGLCGLIALSSAVGSPGQTPAPAAPVSVIPSPLEGAAKWIAVLKSDAPLKDRYAACRELGALGSREAVPALAALLPDDAMSHMARMGLEPISDPSVDEALRAALGAVKGRLLAGVIGSVGARRDAKAVPQLERLLADADTDVACAAAVALGRIAGPEAMAALDRLPAGAPAPVVVAAWSARLACADAMALAGKGADAAAQLDRIRGSADAPPAVRFAALRGAILARGPAGLGLLKESVASGDMAIQAAGFAAARAWSGPEAVRLLAGMSASMPPVLRIAVLQLCGDRADREVAPIVLEAAGAGPAEVRVAAMAALAQIGEPSAAAKLAGWASDPDVTVAAAALSALAGFPGEAGDTAVKGLLSAAGVPARVLGFDLASRRRLLAALPDLAKATGDGDVQVRLGAIKSIGTIGGLAEVPALVARLAVDIPRNELQAVETAVAAIAAREPDPNALAVPLVAGLPASKGAGKTALLRMLRTAPTAASLAAVREAAGGADPAAKAVALRVLCEWPTADAMPDLERMSKDGSDPAVQTLAGRGMIRLIPQLTTPAESRVAALKDILGRATSPEDRVAAISAFGKIASPEALAAVSPFLADASLKTEASAAAVAIAEKIAAQAPEDVSVAMRAVIAAQPTPDVLRRARGLVRETKPPANPK